MSISDRIKIALDIRGLQMKDLAIKAGIPFSTLSDIMSGKRKKLDIQKARDISKALNCSLDYLVGEDCHYQDDIDTGHFYSSALKYERERCNFSLEDLSSETKIPASLLEAYEEGLTPISEFLLKEICDVYGKSINQFLFDNDIYDEEVPEIFDRDVDRYEAFKKARDEDGLRDTYAMQSSAPALGDLPTLTQRDERQIAKDLEDMLHSLKGSAAMGELEDEEDMELLKASLLQAMTLSKRIAKKKFTPKKYRK